MVKLMLEVSFVQLGQEVHQSLPSNYIFIHLFLLYNGAGSGIVVIEWAVDCIHTSEGCTSMEVQY